MALTLTERKRGVIGDLRYAVFDVAFDNSYPAAGAYAANGESLTAADVGMVGIHLVMAESRAGYAFDYDYTNSNLHAYRTAASGSLSHTGGAVDSHSGVAVSAHGTHQHDITLVGAAGGGAAMTEPMVAGALETAGAGQTNTNAVDAGGPTTHTVSAQPGDHMFTQASAHSVAEAALTEVTNATDLSTALANVRVMIWGF